MNWILLVLLAASQTGIHAAEARFRAGAAVADISPTNFPVIVNAMFTERSASQTVDPLEARALVLDDGSTRVAIVLADTCMMPRDLIDQAKARASRATGIPPSRMLVAATHTHSAPSAMGCLGSRADTNYAAFLPGRIAAAMIEANSKLEPAQAGWSAVDDWEHTFNRRWIRRPDRLLDDPYGRLTVRANMHPGHESPDAIGPSGPVDPALTVLAVRTAEGHPLALLANYSQHYYGSPLLSSDYAGRFRTHMAKLLGATNDSPFLAIMSQGTSGDLMWMDYAAPRREIGYDAYAREVAEAALGAWRAVRFQDWAPLRMAERMLPLRYRAPDEKRLEWARTRAAALGGNLPQTRAEIYALEALYLHERPETELVLQALRIGDMGITALPNEVYALTGLKLKAQSPLLPTMNIALANGAEGYIPPPEQHQLGGYTTWDARTAGLETGAEPKIVEAVLGLLEEVSGRARRDAAVSHGPYAAAILAAKPRAYWRFEEMVMRTARDSSPFEAHGEYEDGVALYLPGPGSGEGASPRPALVPSNFSGPGAINRAVHFAGGRMRTSFSPGRSYSVSLWFWNGLDPAARPVTGYLFSRGSADHPAEGEHLGIGGTERPEMQGRLFFASGGSPDRMLAGPTELQRRRWHHVVLTREGSRVSVYLDGKPEVSGQFDVPDRAGTLILGGRSDGHATFEGKLDEVAVFDRPLTAREAEAQFEASGL